MVKDAKNLSSLENFIKDIADADTVSGIKISMQPPKTKLGLDDKIFVLVITPIAEEVIETSEGKLDTRFVKALKDLKYCAKKAIIIDSLAKSGENQSLINGNISVRTDGVSEFDSIEKGVFFDEEEAENYAHAYTKETIKRTRALVKAVKGVEHFLEQLDEAQEKGQV